MWRHFRCGSAPLAADVSRGHWSAMCVWRFVIPAELHKMHGWSIYWLTNWSTINSRLKAIARSMTTTISKKASPEDPDQVEGRFKVTKCILYTFYSLMKFGINILLVVCQGHRKYHHSIERIWLPTDDTFYSNYGCVSCRFWDIQRRKISRPWNPGQGSIKVIKGGTVVHNVFV